MLAELFDRVVTLGRSSRSPVFMHDERLPDRVYLHSFDADGKSTLTQHQVPPPDRKQLVDDFDDLVRYCNDRDLAVDPMLFVNADGIVVQLDLSERREVVLLPFSRSRRFEMVQRMAAERWRGTPREAVRLIRFELHGVGAEPLARALARVDFARRSAGQQTVAHGKESLGRSVEASVQAAEDVPEVFTVRVPMWNNTGLGDFDVEIQMGVLLDVENERIEIGPLADEVSRAEVGALRRLVSYARDQVGEIRVVQGSPGKI